MKALVFGEIIWDVYSDKKVIGGAPFNFSAHLAHLGDEAYLISAIGEDALGEAASDEMHKHGIRTALMQKNRFSTGVCTVTLDAQKIPCYCVHGNTAYDHIEIGEKELAAIRSLHADVFYFNTLIQRGEVSRRSLHTLLENCTFSHIFCDINIRKDCFDAASLRLCMEQATIVKISDEEAHFLYETGVLQADSGDVLQDTAKQFPQLKLIVYTMGGDGSKVLYTATGTVYTSGKPAPVKVVSTVGAGDCFGATFLSSYMASGDIPAAIRQATARSSIVVASREAVPF